MWQRILVHVNISEQVSFGYYSIQIFKYFLYHNILVPFIQVLVILICNP